MKFIVKNWLILTAGLILTAILVIVAYRQRGYIAMGGEWLVIPLLICVKSLLSSFMEEIRNVF